MIIAESGGGVIEILLPVIRYEACGDFLARECSRLVEICSCFIRLSNSYKMFKRTPMSGEMNSKQEGSENLR